MLPGIWESHYHCNGPFVPTSVNASSLFLHPAKSTSTVRALRLTLEASCTESTVNMCGRGQSCKEAKDFLTSWGPVVKHAWRDCRHCCPPAPSSKALASIRLERSIAHWVLVVAPPWSCNILQKRQQHGFAACRTKRAGGAQHPVLHSCEQPAERARTAERFGPTLLPPPAARA